MFLKSVLASHYPALILLAVNLTNIINLSLVFACNGIW